MGAYYTNNVDSPPSHAPARHNNHIPSVLEQSLIISDQYTGGPTGMGLPSEEGPPGASTGTFYDDQPTAHPQDPSPYANGARTVIPYRGGNGTDTPDAASPPLQQREHGDAPAEERSSEQTSRERTRGRRPSGQQRICGKCGRHLTGQFVRALGDTYHLDCFTCHVCRCARC